MNRDLRNQLIALSHDERLSGAFREACRVELGDKPIHISLWPAGTKVHEGYDQ